MVTRYFYVVLEVVSAIGDTIITSIGDENERRRFDMVEFGEQLRKAREEKGMTQQSLAEQLYVTRQSVSRWECGDRYPDLLTTKKISQILEVSLDNLLSGKEMKKVVERNPVIENKVANNIMIALYAFIVFSFVATIVDIVIRFPLQMEAIDYNDILVIAINVLSLIIQIVFFAYGLVNSIRGMLSPKRMGIVIVAYFISMFITDFDNISRGATWQMILFVIMLIIPSILGTVASFLYFVSGKNNKVLLLLVSIASIYGIVRILITNYEMLCYAGQFASMNMALGLLLKISIYVLILYQTYALNKKRKNAIEVSKL